jgi:hypothetical protein
MTIAEQIYSLAKNLPQEQAREILTFAEYIYSKNQSGEAADSMVSWGELVHSLVGAWGDNFPSLEDMRGG